MKISIICGEHSTRIFWDKAGGDIKEYKKLCKQDDDINAPFSREFKSEEEIQAYIIGLDDAAGWMEVAYDFED